MSVLAATVIAAPVSCAASTTESDPTRTEGEPEEPAARGRTGIDDAQPAAESELPTAPDAYQPVVLSPEEVYPNAKQAASEIAQTLTTYESDTSLDEIAAAVGADGDVVETAGDLHHPGSWSRGRVIYPQLGGVTDDRVSVMVVTEQRIGDVEGERTETRTLDIRLRLREGTWQVESLASAGGTRVEAPEQPSSAAQTVLDHPDIELPDSARWDILAGEISIELLELMARAADHKPYGVVVLSTGHPWEIFGTDRESDHTRGQAVDIYQIDDELVVDDRHEGSSTRTFVEWFYEQPEVSRIGSPWALDGFGGRSFTDVVHQDHLHVAVAD